VTVTPSDVGFSISPTSTSSRSFLSCFARADAPSRRSSHKAAHSFLPLLDSPRSSVSVGSLVSLSQPPVFFDAVRTILVRGYIFGDNWTLTTHHAFATHRTVAAQRPRMIASFTHQARFILAIGLLLGQVIRVSSQGTVAASDLPSCADSCALTAAIAAGCTL
jgi:hypothetical protein